MFDPGTGESVAVTSQKPGSPSASSTHFPLALVAPSIAGVTAAQRSAPARAGKLAELGASAVWDVQAAASTASDTTARRFLMATLSFPAFCQDSAGRAVRDPGARSQLPNPEPDPGRNPRQHRSGRAGLDASRRATSLTSPRRPIPTVRARSASPPEP